MHGPDLDSSHSTLSLSMEEIRILCNRIFFMDGEAMPEEAQSSAGRVWRCYALLLLFMH